MSVYLSPALTVDEKSTQIYDLLYGSSNATQIVSASAVRAFRSEYYQRERILGSFVTFFKNEIIGKYNPADYHSLHFTTVQSSGWGKSRMLIESGQYGLNLVYVNLSPDTAMGYPGPNKKIRDHLQRIGKNIKALELFIKCVYYTALKRADGARKAHEELASLRYRSGKNSFFESFWDEVLDNYNKACTNVDFFGIEVADIFKAHQKSHDHSSQETGVLIDGVDGKRLSELVIVFDEARALLPTGEFDQNIFMNLIKAHQNIDSKNVILLFVDTTSRINNLLPPSHLTYRRNFRFQHKLLAPCYEIQTYDCMFFQYLGVECPLGTTEHLEVLASANLEEKSHALAARFIRGRPLWASKFIDDDSTLLLKRNSLLNNFDERINSSIRFAMQRLTASEGATLPDRYYSSIRPSDDGAQATLVALSIRFGIEGIHDPILGEALAARHMATMMYTGEISTHVTFAFPTEPLLSEASCQLLHTKAGSPRDYWASRISSFQPDTVRNNIEFFAHQCMNGFVSAGEMSEIVSRILLGLTFDYCILKREYSRRFLDFSHLFTASITLREFLDSLYPQTFRDEYERLLNPITSVSGQNAAKKAKVQVTRAFEISERLLNGRIILTSFTRIASIPTGNDFELMLRNAYHLGAGILTPSPNLPGIDIIIPIFLDDSSRPTMSYLAVQIKDAKNLSISAAIRAAGEKLTPSNAFSGDTMRYGEEYAAVFLDLNRDTTSPGYFKGEHRTKLIHFHRAFPNHIYLAGLDKSEVVTGANAKIGELLRSLRGARIDTVEMRSRHLPLLGMNPLSYFDYQNKR